MAEVPGRRGLVLCPVPVQAERYEVIRPLGQSAEGAVLLARDAVLGRTVVLRRYGDRSSGAEIGRAREEARAASMIDHPQVVPLLDLEERGGGASEVPELTLVFAYVEGPTLRERSAQGLLDAAAVVHLARELGYALTAVHEAGLVHGRVTPDNVVLTRHGTRLTDAGVLRAPARPAYDPPEGEASPRADQFALASLLGEIVSGKSSTSTGASSLARWRVEPSVSWAPASDPGRPLARMAPVLSRAMSHDPSQRFASCAELAEAVAVALETRLSDFARSSLTPLPTSIIPRATRRTQNYVAAGALLVIVGLLLLGRSTRTASPASPDAAVARDTLPHDPEPAITAAPPTPRADAGARKALAASDAGNPSGLRPPAVVP